MNLLLIITGSVAAEKTPSFITQWQKAGHHITVVMTQAAKKLVPVEIIASATGKQRIFDDLWDAEMEEKIGHIELSRQADAILVAPASADMLAKMAHGICDDLASTLLLATNKPVFVAPAMNVKMWEHAATHRNVRQLQEDGIRFIGPVKGAMRCGETGIGRMEEPENIQQQLEKWWQQQQTISAGLKNKRLLITAGATRERLDPVRYLTNDSSGKQGYAIARMAARLGAHVTLISGHTNLPCPAGVQRITIESATEMLAACETLLNAKTPVDAAICTAAVADFRPEEQHESKQKRGEKTSLTLKLTANPDILKIIANHPKRPACVVGFAAETDHLIPNAQAKLKAKHCDLILANNVSLGAVFGQDETHLHAITANGSDDWGVMSKDAAAEKLLHLLALHPA